MDNANSSDKIAIISGYCSPDTIEKIARLGKKLDFYFGMASRGALTPLLLNKLQDLEQIILIKKFLLYQTIMYIQSVIFLKKTEVLKIY
ncbi:restriction endonuclease PLD domain-containing protein [Streptococcus thermophilus]|uniref:restriction endonuclease PLD domain-containing protein n=1 Tax=Streptococcus thermophilus TaxID=1308 RepID=UPI003865242E